VYIPTQQAITAATEELIKTALEKKSYDNITVMLISLK